MKSTQLLDILAHPLTYPTIPKITREIKCKDPSNIGTCLITEPFDWGLALMDAIIAGEPAKPIPKHIVIPNTTIPLPVKIVGNAIYCDRDKIPNEEEMLLQDFQVNDLIQRGIRRLWLATIHLKIGCVLTSTAGFGVEHDCSISMAYPNLIFEATSNATYMPR